MALVLLHFVIFYPEEDLSYRSKYCFSLNISKYIFGFSFVVWRWFFFTLLLLVCLILVGIQVENQPDEMSNTNPLPQLSAGSMDCLALHQDGLYVAGQVVLDHFQSLCIFIMYLYM